MVHGVRGGQTTRRNLPYFPPPSDYAFSPEIGNFGPQTIVRGESCPAPTQKWGEDYFTSALLYLNNLIAAVQGFLPRESRLPQASLTTATMQIFK